MPRSPALAGTLLALASAAAFGATAPLVQRLARGAGAFATAALLYLGAAGVAALTRARAGREAPLVRAHAGRVLAMAFLGAFVGPACLVWGLARTSGTSASLMLSLEAAFTVLLARAVYREPIGRRVAAAVTMIAGGGVALALSSAEGGGIAAAGIVAVAVATAAWAADNVIGKPLSQLDPARVVLAKALAGAALSGISSLAAGDRWPVAASGLGLLACGATGYGLSLRLYLLAQRRVGAGRTGSIFATGPLLGALLAWGLGESLGGARGAAAAAAMALGVALHATEAHRHEHVHEAIEHDHAHRHDDGHHDHRHEPMPAGEHSHPHRHERIVHAHPHMPDPHHEHEHG
jgi:drug/metabolite transporter (DMT)-like permease